MTSMLGLEGSNDLWQGGITYNLAEEEFLEFCASNKLMMMNTWLQKKVKLGTWIHPATKRSHMIDFVVMSSGQRI